MFKRYRNIFVTSLFSVFTVGLSACLSSSDSGQPNRIDSRQSPATVIETQDIETPDEIFLRMDGYIDRIDTLILQHNPGRDHFSPVESEQLRQKLKQMRGRLEE